MKSNDSCAPDNSPLAKSTFYDACVRGLIPSVSAFVKVSHSYSASPSLTVVLSSNTVRHTSNAVAHTKGMGMGSSSYAAYSSRVCQSSRCITKLGGTIKETTTETVPMIG